jgi:hypothetical protein
MVLLTNFLEKFACEGQVWLSPLNLYILPTWFFKSEFYRLNLYKVSISIYCDVLVKTRGILESLQEENLFTLHYQSASKRTASFDPSI